MGAGKKLSRQRRSLITTSRAVCINFCSHYKPDKAEDLACQGFTVIERLIKEGRRFPLEKGDAAIGPALSLMLAKMVCAQCSFREDGCDFAAGQKGARPCGGFLLLGRLVETGALHVDDL